MSVNENPIGIFDSGLGGLTVVKELLQKLPDENIVFLGDTKNVPYGDKTPEQLFVLASNNIEFLLSKGAKAIAVACNTVDSTALKALRQKYNNIPIIGVVSPAAQKAAECTKNKKIGVIATATTVSSGAYERAIKQLDENCTVYSVPAPLLVPLVEEGRVHKGDDIIEGALLSYLTPLREKGIDTLVLGCTHYPLFYDLVTDILPDCNIICSGNSSYDAIYEVLKNNNLLNKSKKQGKADYFVTDNPLYFEKHAEMFLHSSLEGKVQKTIL